MNRLLRSSAFTLAFSYVAFGIAALVLFAAPLWYAYYVTIQDARLEALRTDTQRLSEVFHRQGPPGLSTYIDNRVGMQIPGERILLLTDSTLHPLAGNLSAWPAVVPLEPGEYDLPVNLSGKDTRAMFVHSVLPGGYNLLVGRDQSLFAPLAARFWFGLAAAVAVLSIAGVVGGLMIRRAVLVRVDGIHHTVQAIVRGDWSHRLPAKAGSDELNTLSRTINGMLDQIEQLLHGVRDVSNSIAHDLRTPLAELRSRLEELSLTRPESEETFAEIDGAVVDVDRVILIFNALLRLAEIDTGMRRSGFVPVNAADIARQAVDFYLPAAELKGVTLSYRGTGATDISGDPVLLAQAIGNLIDNALKYTSAGGGISVEVQALADGKVQIAVADDGPGIPDEEKPKVSARFYRGDASRGTPGVGLGLTLVASVAKVHGGVLELGDNNPGLRANMVISAQSGNATGALQPALVEGRAGAAAAAHNLRMRSVS
ncbi:MAG TPA: HAMP domain-containing sensor histidine kinase [Steroidobacteraceae bacterium]|nr:HAMP domain-containing sensor histidine kinase [Steroidobacteraceae bacterium]